LRVVFIQPPNKDVFMCTPLLGVGYLMGYLKNKGVECEYIDGVKTRQSIKEIVEVCRNKTPDLIAVTIMTVFYNNAKKLINALSQLNIPIVIGGAHVSALPVKTLKDLKGDYAIYGEGEKTLYKLVEHLKNKKNDIRKIEGMVYKDNRGNVIKNPPMSLIENLDELPLPAWDLMDPRTYPFAPHGSIAKEYPVAPILTSRGCPFSCDFCSVNVIWRNKYRMRSIENVVDEIEFLVKKYGVKEIHFEDDNLTLTKGRVVKLCKEITRRKLRFIWSCPNGVRIDSLDEETLRFMKRSGCYSLTFGIESGNQEILNNVNKRLNLKVVKRVVDMTKKLGIETRAFFIIGLPGETRRTVEETIDFALSLNLDIAGFFLLALLPGSKIFNEWIKKNGIDMAEIDWTRINKSRGKDPISICNLSSRQICMLYKRAYRKFYLRPHILFRTMGKLRIIQVKWLMKRFLSMTG